MQFGRRAFLQGRAAAPSATTRPPGAVEATFFSQLCDHCAECARICPTGIIKLIDGMPALDFSAGQCVRCGECARHCASGALRKPERFGCGLVATISERCLAMRGIECRLCGDHCEAHAIRFLPSRRGTRLPEIEAGLCTGCGACFAPCPSAAVEFFPTQECTA